jgi:hypothetical protein
MYRCKACNKVVPAGTAQVKVVVETRKKTYDVTQTPNDKDAKRAQRRGFKIETQKRFAQGWEIQREAALCPQCATNWAAQHGDPAPAATPEGEVESDAPQLAEGAPAI